MSTCETTIYHGTPLTPRGALKAVCTGRAMCVSFWRPDDLEVVEAISPGIMFRQWGLFRMAGGAKTWRGMVYSTRLDTLFPMAGADTFSSGSVGSHSRCSRRTKSAQRFPSPVVAVRTIKGRSPLAHGPTTRAVAFAMRAFPPRVFGLDRRRNASRHLGLSSQNGGCRSRFGKPMACSAHDARNCSSGDVSFRQRRRDFSGTERMAL